ncbi:Protein CBG02889 [Caenorhabditis briggsae]|uniref:Protein CBG02889 n=1 Tax=Caenorhabditis briggsae TaxID=6238 RepID=A8WTA1_CAEBR|nr:Protein CBG02889 [Caenorhabditis briggsae]CAP23712.1 Protein CBG02889 [Caenorhabditis briggsae]
MNLVKTCFLFLLPLSLNSVFCVTDLTTDQPDSYAEIPTSLGYLRGVKVPTKQGFYVDYFKGVPFAEKPERLRKSELVHRWPGIYKALKYPPKCIPAHRPANESEFSEDCLYLNILKPSGLNTVEKYPVVVFIHGGGFQEGMGYWKILEQKREYSGDGNDASCEAFAENFVSKGMIVITIQYRLAMLGFLSLGCTDPLIPCNLGLWDMVTAFEYINKTIEDFNGDVNRMTLMGHSAGAMAVSLHSLSPISSVYFQNYIQLSASSWLLTKYKTSNVENTQRILHDLNCNISSAKTIFECVNSSSLDSMYSAQVDTNLWPQFGDDLLPDIPDNLVRTTQNQKVMLGMMTLESLYFTYLKSSPTIFPFIQRSTIEEYINSSVAIQYGTNWESANDDLSNHYLSKNASENDYPYFMWQRSLIDSNMVFDMPILREARARSLVSPNLYLYHFPYFNPAEFDETFPVKATYHCQEFPYIWGVYKDNYFEFNDDDRVVSSFLITSLTNFILTGNPSTSNFTWKLYDSNVTHTVIQPTPITGQNLFQSDFNFWESMAARFQFDLITGLPVGNIETTTSSTSPISVTLLLLSVFIIALA